MDGSGTHVAVKLASDMDKPPAQGERDMAPREETSVQGSSIRVGNGVGRERASSTPPQAERTTPVRTRDVGKRSHAAGLAWVGWISGIVVAEMVWGTFAAAGWWLLYWPALLLVVLLYLYSPLAPEGGKSLESDRPEAPSPLGSLMLQRQPPSLEHEPAQVPNGGLAMPDRQVG